MKRASVLLVLLSTALHAQQPSLFPHATWLQDVHFAGTIYAGIPAPLIPGVQAHLGGLEYMFHLKSDVPKAAPLIDAVHAQGKKYWVNLDASTIEGNVDSIINDGQGITDPDFGMLTSLEGNPITIGGKKMKGVTRPAWRNFLIACIKRAIDAGADGSQHDFGWSVPPEDFDDDEMTPFREYLQSLGVSTGSWNPATQTFRAYLLGIGKTDATVLENDGDPSDLRSLMQHWREFKAYRTTQAWQMLKDSCSAYAAGKGKSYTIALNAASAFGQAGGNSSLVSDFAVGEFFDWGNLFPYDGTLTTRVKTFQALGKRFILWSPPTLADVPLAQPTDLYQEPLQTNAVLHTAATLYASGGLPQLGYPSPGTYPAYFLAQTHRALFNSVSPAGEIGVVLSHAQTLDDMRGYNGLVSVLIDLNRAFNVIWFKPGKMGLADDLSQSDLSPYRVIFIPEAFRLTDNQRSQLLTYVQNGGTIVAVRGNVEYTGWQNAFGQPQSDPTWESLADRSSSGVAVHGTGRFITIAHHINESSGYPPPLYGQAYVAWERSPDPAERAVADRIRDTVAFWLDVALPERDVVAPDLPGVVKVFRFQDTLTHTYVYQMLNDSVQIPTRAPIAVGPANVFFRVARSLAGRTMTASFSTVADPQGTTLGSAFAVDSATGMVGPITVPAFATWGFIRLTVNDGAPGPGIAIGGMTINDTTHAYRLKSGSDVHVRWTVSAGTQQGYEVEAWTNVDEEGSPALSDRLAQFAAGGASPDGGIVRRADRVLHAIVAAPVTQHTIPGVSLHDSTVYLIRLRAVSAAPETTAWLEQYCYRNAPPAPPVEPSILVQHQNTWYLSTHGEVSAGADTARRMIYSIKKGGDRRGQYGGDWELDTLLYGIMLYTDSLSARRGDTADAVHPIGSQFLMRLGPSQSKEGTDDLKDTLAFSLDAYENFGIYFRPYASDGIDTSVAGQWFGYYLDSRNDPPNPFHLISPPDGGYVPGQVAFRWKNNKDPDPFHPADRNISQVQILFDSVQTFSSSGLRTYTKSPAGNEFEGDTITLQLPTNYFTVEGLQQYRRIFWKVKMWDFDRSVDEGGGGGPLVRESDAPFVLHIGTDPGGTAQFASSVDSVAFGPVRVGMRRDSIVVFHNPGSDTLRITGITGTGTVFRSLRNAMVIPPGGSRPDTLRFEPASPGPAAGSIVVHSNAAGSPDTIRVRGFGATYALTLSRTVVHFGTVRVGTTKDTVVMLNNAGNQPLVVSAIMSSLPPFSSALTSVTIPVGGGVADTLRFSPLSDGPLSAWILITSAARPAPDTIFVSGNGTLTGVPGEAGLPEAFILLPAYPNPFNPVTHLRYGVPERSTVGFTVFNLLGQQVLAVPPSVREGGYHEEAFDARGLSSGIYLCVMEAVSQVTTGRSYRSTQKVVLMK